MLCKLVEEANRKGYSGSELCMLVNQAGLKCHINTFRTAVRDGIDRTKRQEAIYDLASSILKDLPVRDPDANDFTARAKQAGFTLKEVWQYYQETREQKYVYGAFVAALKRRTTPFEIVLSHEAEKCLAEMITARED